MSAAADARREEVLAALVQAGPGGVSGEALAAHLGCSRAAVHRHVEALRRAGLDVAGGQDGYRLDPEADPVVPGLVAPRLAPPLAGPVTWRAETGSTNDDLTALARDGAPEGTVVGADRQSAGRGRRGRTWLAASGHALLVSVLLRPGRRAGGRGPAAHRGGGRGGGGAGRRRPDRLAERHPRRRPEGRGDPVRDVGRPGARGVGGRRDRRERPLRPRPGRRPLEPRRPRRPGRRRRARADLLVGLLDALGRRYAQWTREGPAPIVRPSRSATSGGPPDRGEPAGRRGRPAPPTAPTTSAASASSPTTASAPLRRRGRPGRSVGGRAARRPRTPR